MTRMESVAFHGAKRKRGGRGRASFSHKFTIFLYFLSGIKDLWSWGKTDFKKNKTTNNMQVSKFSSFRVYCRKRGKTDKLEISKASSWFSILLLGLHFLLLIFFLLSLFVLFLLFHWCLVLYREFLQLLCHFVCAISVACGKTVKCAINNTAMKVWTQLSASSACLACKFRS